MSLNKCIGLVSMAVLGSALAVGCSSKSDGNPSTPEADAAVVKDSGPNRPETSVPVGDDDDAGDSGASACVPADETGFKPTWHNNVDKQTVCTDAQIKSFGKCLDNQSDDTLCSPWFGSSPTALNKTCLACMLTPSTAPAYGALILKGNVFQPNTAGCLAVALKDPGGTGCAGKFQARAQCTDAACTANCPVDQAHPNSIDELNACINTASSGTCASFDGSCADAFTDGTPEKTCLGEGINDFGDYIAVLAGVMCKGDDSDASTPADAAAE